MKLPQLSDFKTDIKLLETRLSSRSEQIKLNKYENFLVDLSNEIDVGENAFEDTIAILKKTNCVITSDTAIVHLAATLNIKTYLFINKLMSRLYNFEYDS